jgi:hypothetical protein
MVSPEVNLKLCATKSPSLGEGYFAAFAAASRIEKLNTVAGRIMCGRISKGNHEAMTNRRLRANAVHPERSAKEGKDSVKVTLLVSRRYFSTAPQVDYIEA